MRFFRSTRGEERDFLGSSFERDGESWLFYRHHWARGIRVSAEEREAYLRPALDGSRRAFYAAIEGRPASAKRRPFLSSQRATLAAIPAGFGLGLVLTGAMLIWRGLGFEDPELRWLLTGSGALAALYGALVLAVRIRPRRGGA